jgi:hypothetical protein
MNLHSRRIRLKDEYESFTLTFVYAVEGRYTKLIREDGRSFPVILFHSGLKRRVFWTCYILHRQSSIATGRPFAISDQDLDASLHLGNLLDSNLVQILAATSRYRRLLRCSSIQQSSIVTLRLAYFRQKQRNVLLHLANEARKN